MQFVIPYVVQKFWRFLMSFVIKKFTFSKFWMIWLLGRMCPTGFKDFVCQSKKLLKSSCWHQCFFCKKKLFLSFLFTGLLSSKIWPSLFSFYCQSELESQKLESLTFAIVFSVKNISDRFLQFALNKMLKQCQGFEINTLTCCKKSIKN